MLITKSLETAVDLLDPNDIFAPDIDALIIKKLTERYANRCYQSMLVLKVLRVIQRSLVRMADNRLDGGAFVNVQFEVEGIALCQNEIIHSCKIIEIMPNAITAENKYAGIKIQQDQTTKILQVGQIVPIVVQRVRYTPNEALISVMGSLFVPKVQGNVYCSLTSGLTPEETEKVSVMLDKIRAEEKQIPKGNLTDFFASLLYPYKVGQKYEYIKFVSDAKFKPVPLELKQLTSLNSGLVVFPIEDQRTNKRIFHTSGGSHTSGAPDIRDAKGTVVKCTAYAALSNILTKQLLYFSALRGFVETYSEVESMKVYWHLCQGARA